MTPRHVGSCEYERNVIIGGVGLGVIVCAHPSAAVIRHDDQQRMFGEIRQHTDRGVDFHRRRAVLRRHPAVSVAGLIAIIEIDEEEALLCQRDRQRCARDVTGAQSRGPALPEAGGLRQRPHDRALRRQQLTHDDLTGNAAPR